MSSRIPSQDLREGRSTQESTGQVSVRSEAMEDEDLARAALGDWGRWQVPVILLISVIKLPIAWTQLGIVFLAPKVPFHCVNSSQTCTTERGDTCTAWEYDRSVFSETIISEWDLVCQKHQLVNVTQMILMVGILLGNILFSVAADRFGRKIPLVLSGFLQMLTGVCSSLCSSFSLFLMFRFLQAVATGGAMTISFVLCMELLSGKSRTTITTLSHIPFNIGHETMVVIAYYTRNWRYFQLAVSIPAAFALVYIWLIPESPRWLLAVGRREEALVVLKKAATANNNPLPVDIKPQKKTVEKEEENKANMLDLLRTPNMRKKTLAMCYNWMACGLGFYGLAQYVSTIGGNIFLNVALAGSFAVPGMLITMYTLDRFGRKPTMISGQVLASVCCFLIIFFPEGPGNSDLPRVALASLGILGMGISFPTVYLYSGELFPTVVRNVGVGSGSMCARVGSMVAPFIASLGEYNQYLSPLIFSFITLSGGALGMLLPETRGTQLPQSLQEGEDFGKKLKPGHRTAAGGTRNQGFEPGH